MKLLSLICVLVSLSHSAFAENIFRNVVAPDTVNAHWIILHATSNLDSLRANGSVTASGYYSVPKTLSLPYQYYDGGKSVRVFLPSSNQFSTAAVDAPPFQFPKGLRSINTSNMSDEIDLKTSLDLPVWLATLGAKINVNYRNCAVAEEITRTELDKFSIENFHSAFRSCMDKDKATFFTLTRDAGTFSDDDVETLSSFFTYEIRNLVTKIDSKVFEYAFPEAGVWYSGSAAKVKFYEAYDSIDAGLVPLVRADAEFLKSGLASSDDLWLMNFIEKAKTHYFLSSDANRSCPAYEVVLKRHDQNETFQQSYFEPTINALVIKLSPVQNQ